MIEPLCVNASSISVSLSSDGALLHERATVISCGAGRRIPSQSAAAITRPSHSSMPKLSRASKKPGSAKSRPATSSQMARGVRPNAKRPRARQAARTVSGWSEPEGILRARHRDRCEHVVQNAIGIEAFELCFGLEDDAMTKHGARGAFHVIGNGIVAI